MQKAKQETMQPPAGRRWLSQFLPISSWLPSYQRGLLRPDLLAGATVWAVTVPEAIAYAQLAGVPAQMGLFAAPFLMLGYVLFGTSRQLMVGATSASAIMLATTAGDLAGGKGGNYVPVVTGITLLFHNLPDAVLGAIILHAVWGLLRVKELRRYARLRRLDLALALVALFGVLIFDILPGLLLAVVLSLVILIYRASRPRGSVLGRVPGSEVYGDIARHPGNETVPGLLIFRLDAPLFFANSALMRERVKTLARNATPPTRAVLLDLQASNDLDISSVDMLAELAGELQTEGSELLLANALGPVRDMLRRSQVLQRLDEQHLFASLAEAVAAFQHSA